MAASLVLALAIVPPLAHALFAKRSIRIRTRLIVNALIVVIGLWVGYSLSLWIGAPVVFIGLVKCFALYLPQAWQQRIPTVLNVSALGFVIFLLTEHWLPLGPEKGLIRNLVFASGIIFGLLAVRKIFTAFYRPLLSWALDHKAAFLMVPGSLILFGLVIWLGFERVFAFIPWTADRFLVRPAHSITAGQDPVAAGRPDAAQSTKETVNPIRKTRVWSKLAHAFPGLGKEFMPDLDEGSFLFMPTTMPHASIGEALDVIQKQDMAIRTIPEVESVVGKIGRVESALDPAPLSMIETLITYLPEYKIDPSTGERVQDPKTGKPIRNWRPHIKTPADIWKEIVEAARLPGTTSAPKLQPITARIVMLQSGMRAAMGVKVRGKSLEEVEQVGLNIERLLKEVPSIEPSSVIADRVVGNPIS